MQFRIGRKEAGVVAISCGTVQRKMAFAGFSGLGFIDLYHALAQFNEGGWNAILN